MNQVCLIGNVTKDIDVRYSQGAEPMAVARLTVAVARRKPNEADFINCLAFGKTAENIGKYFAKGSKIAVTGHIQTGSYTKQDGTKVYTTDVVIDSFDFCERSTPNQAPNNAQATSYAPQAQQPSYAPQNAPQGNMQYSQPTQFAPNQAQQAISAINAGFMAVPDNVEEGLPWSQ